LRRWLSEIARRCRDRGDHLDGHLNGGRRGPVFG
jgi:hypothetical protein